MIQITYNCYFIYLKLGNRAIEGTRLMQIGRVFKNDSYLFVMNGLYRCIKIM